MIKQHTYLEFTVKALDVVHMWPTENHGFSHWVKEYLVLVFLVASTLPMMVDEIMQFYEDEVSLSSAVEDLVGISALCSVIYVSICYMFKKNEIKSLVDSLRIFEQFAPRCLILDTEEHIAFYTKFFILYGIVGNICYALVPIFAYKSCNENRNEYMRRYGMSCGVIAHYILPFKYDYSPIKEIVIVQQSLACCLGTTIILMITMLVCGILYHLTANLKFLKGLIEQGADMKGKKLEKHVKWCVKYHTAIIDFTNRTNNCFHLMMLVHICWTSLIISILGFEIIEEGNNTNGLRFAMHLLGWLGMLYLVCYYGQILMDKSSDISEAIYSGIQWYDKPPKVRKSLVLMLLRSQRPLSLKAARLKAMSLASFLGILYNAYSYFTLLLKFRRN